MVEKITMECIRYRRLVERGVVMPGRNRVRRALSHYQPCPIKLRA